MTLFRQLTLTKILLYFYIIHYGSTNIISGDNPSTPQSRSTKSQLSSDIEVIPHLYQIFDPSQDGQSLTPTCIANTLQSPILDIKEKETQEKIIETPNKLKHSHDCIICKLKSNTEKQESFKKDTKINDIDEIPNKDELSKEPQIVDLEASNTICIAGYDNEIYKLMNDINTDQGTEVLIIFYAYKDSRYSYLGCSMIDLDMFKKKLMKYSHYYILCTNYLEKYNKETNTWYINDFMIHSNTEINETRTNDLKNDQIETVFKRFTPHLDGTDIYFDCFDNIVPIFKKEEVKSNKGYIVLENDMSCNGQDTDKFTKLEPKYDKENNRFEVHLPKEPNINTNPISLHLYFNRSSNNETTNSSPEVEFDDDMNKNGEDVNFNCESEKRCTDTNNDRPSETDEYETTDEEITSDHLNYWSSLNNDLGANKFIFDDEIVSNDDEFVTINNVLSSDISEPPGLFAKSNYLDSIDNHLLEQDLSNTQEKIPEEYLDFLPFDNHKYSDPQILCADLQTNKPRTPSNTYWTNLNPYNFDRIINTHNNPKLSTTMTSKSEINNQLYPQPGTLHENYLLHGKNNEISKDNLNFKPISLINSQLNLIGKQNEKYKWSNHVDNLKIPTVLKDATIQNINTGNLCNTFLPHQETQLSASSYINCINSNHFKELKNKISFNNIRPIYFNDRAIPNAKLNIDPNIDCDRNKVTNLHPRTYKIVETQETPLFEHIYDMPNIINKKNPFIEGKINTRQINKPLTPTKMYTQYQPILKSTLDNSFILTPDSKCNKHNDDGSSIDYISSDEFNQIVQRPKSTLHIPSVKCDATKENIQTINLEPSTETLFFSPATYPNINLKAGLNIVTNKPFEELNTDKSISSNGITNLIPYSETPNINHAILKNRLSIILKPCLESEEVSQININNDSNILPIMDQNSLKVYPITNIDGNNIKSFYTNIITDKQKTQNFNDINPYKANLLHIYPTFTKNNEELELAIQDPSTLYPIFNTVYVNAANIEETVPLIVGKQSFQQNKNNVGEKCPLSDEMNPQNIQRGFLMNNYLDSTENNAKPIFPFLDNQTIMLQGTESVDNIDLKQTFGQIVPIETNEKTSPSYQTFKTKDLVDSSNPRPIMNDFHKLDTDLFKFTPQQNVLIDTENSKLTNIATSNINNNQKSIKSKDNIETVVEKPYLVNKHTYLSNLNRSPDFKNTISNNLNKNPAYCQPSILSPQGPSSNLLTKPVPYMSLREDIKNIKPVRINPLNSLTTDFVTNINNNKKYEINKPNYTLNNIESNKHNIINYQNDPNVQESNLEKNINPFYATQRPVSFIKFGNTTPYFEMHSSLSLNTFEPKFESLYAPSISPLKWPLEIQLNNDAVAYPEYHEVKPTDFKPLSCNHNNYNDFGNVLQPQFNNLPININKELSTNKIDDPQKPVIKSNNNVFLPNADYTQTPKFKYFHQVKPVLPQLNQNSINSYFIDDKGSSIDNNANTKSMIKEGAKDNTEIESNITNELDNAKTLYPQYMPRCNTPITSLNHINPFSTINNFNTGYSKIYDPKSEYWDNINIGINSVTESKFKDINKINDYAKDQFINIGRTRSVFPKKQDYLHPHVNNNLPRLDEVNIPECVNNDQEDNTINLNNKKYLKEYDMYSKSNKNLIQTQETKDIIDTLKRNKLMRNNYNVYSQINTKTLFTSNFQQNIGNQYLRTPASTLNFWSNLPELEPVPSNKLKYYNPITSTSPLEISPKNPFINQIPLRSSSSYALPFLSSNLNGQSSKTPSLETSPNYLSNLPKPVTSNKSIKYNNPITSESLLESLPNIPSRATNSMPFSTSFPHDLPSLTNIYKPSLKSPPLTSLSYLPMISQEFVKPNTLKTTMSLPEIFRNIPTETMTNPILSSLSTPSNALSLSPTFLYEQSNKAPVFETSLNILSNPLKSAIFSEPTKSNTLITGSPLNIFSNSHLKTMGIANSIHLNPPSSYALPSPTNAYQQPITTPTISKLQSSNNSIKFYNPITASPLLKTSPNISRKTIANPMPLSTSFYVPQPPAKIYKQSMKSPLGNSQTFLKNLPKTIIPYESTKLQTPLTLPLNTFSNSPSEFKEISNTVPIAALASYNLPLSPTNIYEQALKNPTLGVLQNIFLDLSNLPPNETVKLNAPITQTSSLEFFKNIPSESLADLETLSPTSSYFSPSLPTNSYQLSIKTPAIGTIQDFLSNLPKPVATDSFGMSSQLAQPSPIEPASSMTSLYNLFSASLPKESYLETLQNAFADIKQGSAKLTGVCPQICQPLSNLLNSYDLLTPRTYEQPIQAPYLRVSNSLLPNPTQAVNKNAVACPHANKALPYIENVYTPFTSSNNGLRSLEKSSLLPLQSLSSMTNINQLINPYNLESPDISRLLTSNIKLPSLEPINIPTSSVTKTVSPVAGFFPKSNKATSFYDLQNINTIQPSNFDQQPLKPIDVSLTAKTITKHPQMNTVCSNTQNPYFILSSNSNQPSLEPVDIPLSSTSGSVSTNSINIYPSLTSSNKNVLTSFSVPLSTTSLGTSKNPMFVPWTSNAKSNIKLPSNLAVAPQFKIATSCGNFAKSVQQPFSECSCMPSNLTVALPLKSANIYPQSNLMLSNNILENPSSIPSSKPSSLETFKNLLPNRFTPLISKSNQEITSDFPVTAKSVATPQTNLASFYSNLKKSQPNILIPRTNNYSVTPLNNITPNSYIPTSIQDSSTKIVNNPEIDDISPVPPHNLNPIFSPQTSAPYFNQEVSKSPYSEDSLNSISNTPSNVSPILPIFSSSPIENIPILNNPITYTSTPSYQNVSPSLISPGISSLTLTQPLLGQTNNNPTAIPGKPFYTVANNNPSYENILGKSFSSPLEPFREVSSSIPSLITQPSKSQSNLNLISTSKMPIPINLAVSRNPLTNKETQNPLISSSRTSSIFSSNLPSYLEPTIPQSNLNSIPIAERPIASNINTAQTLSPYVYSKPIESVSQSYFKPNSFGTQSSLLNAPTSFYQSPIESKPILLSPSIPLQLNNIINQGDINSNPWQQNIGLYKQNLNYKSQNMMYPQNNYHIVENAKQNLPLSNSIVNLSKTLETDIIKNIKSSETLKNMNNNENITIPLANIGIVKYIENGKENTCVVNTDDPNIILKGWYSKLKVLKAKLIIEASDNQIANFIPVVYNKARYNLDVVQEVAKDAIAQIYGEPLVVKGVYSKEQPYAVVNVENALLGDKFSILWPCYCNCEKPSCDCYFKNLK